MARLYPSDDELRASERWLIDRPEARAGEPVAAVWYPNQYAVGMSNLGLHRLLEMVAEHPRWTHDRVFVPQPHHAGSDRNLELRTFDLGVPVRRTDLALVSASYEEDYTQLAVLLDLAGIPRCAADREEEHPVIVVGGFAVTLNPEPLASLADVFLLGPAEHVLQPFLDRAAEIRATAGRLRRVPLRSELDDLPGCYVPGPDPQSRPVRVTFAAPRWRTGRDALCETDDPAADRPPPRSRILSPHTEFADRYLVAVGEGCPHGCRFCAAGFSRRPPLAYPAERLRAAVGEGLGHTRRIGLVGPAVTDLPGLDSITRQVVDAGGEVSTSSLGVRSMLRTGLTPTSRTVTLAPETAGDELRARVNKPMADTDILDALQACAENGVIRIRLYFLVGLPGEQDADVDGIVALAAACHDRLAVAGRRLGQIPALVLSINPFVPKAGTPFQWSPMADVSTIRRRLERLRKGLRPIGGVTLRTGGARVALRQSVLSLGDRDAAAVLDLHPGRTGWWKDLQRWHADHGEFVSVEKARDHLFPWDFIDRGVSKDYLWKEAERAKRGKVTPPCDVIKCTACGACG